MSTEFDTYTCLMHFQFPTGENENAHFSQLLLYFTLETERIK
jgi:hypothetical protein